MSRVRAAELMAVAGGSLLVVALFLPWYSGAAYGNAWRSFAVVDVVLAVTGLLGISLFAAQSTRTSPALPVALQVVTIPVALIGTALALWRLLDAPGPVDVRYGAALGLAGAAGVLAGAWLGLKDESAPGVRVPGVPRRPAPPAGS